LQCTIYCLCELQFYSSGATTEHILLHRSSIFLQRIDLPKWTPYHEECLQILEKTEGYPTDETFIVLLRIQVLKNKTCSTASLEQSTAGFVSSQFRHDMYLDTIGSHFETLKQSLPKHLKTSCRFTEFIVTRLLLFADTINLQTLDAMISLHEYNLAPEPTKLSSTQKMSADIDNQDEHLSRLQGLKTLLSFVKQYITTTLDDSTFPLAQYLELSMATFTQMAHVIMVLFRLSTFESPGLQWDQRKVIREMDFGVVVRQWSQKWLSVPSHCGLTGELQTGNAEDGQISREQGQVEGKGQNGQENTWTHAGKVFGLLANAWDSKVLPKLFPEERNRMAAAMPVNGLGELDINQQLQQSYVQPIPGFADVMFNWDIPEERWVMDLLGDSGPEWFLNY
jgi:hypothetical protein